MSTCGEIILDKTAFGCILRSLYKINQELCSLVNLLCSQRYTSKIGEAVQDTGPPETVFVLFQVQVVGPTR